MRITESARKHGVDDNSMLHAIRNYVRVFELDEVAMFIRPAEDGAMLEIGVVSDDEDPRIIHAMPARRRFWP